MMNHVIRPAHDVNLNGALAAPVEIHPGSFYHADEIEPGTLHNQISLPR